MKQSDRSPDISTGQPLPPWAVERLPFLAGGGLILIWSIILFMLGDDDYVSEDALFYLRYAYNLANGYGLVYNPGEYYESNTNFLWSILLTPPFWLGLDPITSLRALGVAIGAVCLWMAYKLAERLEGPIAAMLVVFLLGFHYSFLVVVNSGFAPHLVALLALSAIYWCLKLEKRPTIANGAVVAALMALLLLTRLDASLIFGVVWLLAMVAIKPWKNPRATAAVTAIVGAAPLVLFGLYLLWKLSYYDDIFPAPYYAKAGPSIPDYYEFTGRGLRYLQTYFSKYWFIPLLPFLVCGIWRRFPLYYSFSMEAMARVACIAVVLVWCAYMIKVGGGYTGFRFMVTIAPFLFVAIISALWFDKAIAIISTVILMVGSAHFNMTFQTINEGGFFVFRPHITPHEHPRWAKFRKIGDVLGEMFAEFGEYSPHVKIATNVGGTIPFRSKLFTVETLGWADPRIALPENHIVTFDNKPGHTFQVSPSFLLQQKINLFIGEPLFVAKSEHNEELFRTDRIDSHMRNMSPVLAGFPLPSDVQLVRLPISDEFDIVALYLTRNAELDEFFARKGYYVHNVF